jgi:hypothetical protein
VALWLAGDPEEAASSSLDVEVEPDRLKEIKVFVSQPRDAVRPGSTDFSFALVEEGGETASEETEFFAPES